MVSELPKRGLSGLPTLLLLLVGIGLVLWQVITAANTGNDAAAWYLVPTLLVLLVGLGRLVIVPPNEARVLVLFGKYAGTLRHDGSWWVNPFMEKQKLSLRVRNFETTKLKANRSVEGAVGMVENAVSLLSSREIITLDDERQAAMVSNLPVVLRSERGTTPVVNTGSLYQ